MTSTKAALLEAIAGTNRGLLATEIDRIKILSFLAQLEDHNPMPHPLEQAESLEGDWRLVYTTSKSLLGLDRFPLWQLGQIYQCIRLRTKQLYNIAEFVGVPLLEGLVSVVAHFEVISPQRVDVFFDRTILTPQRLISYRSPRSFIQAIESGQKFPPLDISYQTKQASGWLETTYLDEDLRIGRGNEGSIFVLSKEKSFLGQE